MTHSSPLQPARLGWETAFVALLLILTFVPFLGENLFTTKGEPREALVAVSMLAQDNWILPVSFGADIPYKPPMLAWCVALLGWLNGGVITEPICRLPSALAAIVMIIAGFRLVARRMGVFQGAAMAMITATSFEVFRAATICRVDMLMTMFMVCSVYALFRQWSLHPGGTWRPSLPAGLLMTGAVLTKGPVGMLLPCGIMLIFRLCRGQNFLQAFVSLAVTGLLSLILPALWYYAASLQGGDEFLELAMEENFGRFSGSMSYSSHEHGIGYNFTSLLSGFAPWTLLILLGLFAAPWRYLRRETMSMRRKLRLSEPLQLLSVIAALVIFVFYCIPKSKRSVYLLPMYPFLGYLTARYVLLLINHGPRLLKSYCWIICGAGFAASVAVAAAMWLPEGTLSLGEKNAPILAALRGEGSGLLAPVLTLALFLGSLLLARVICRFKVRGAIAWTTLYTLLIYMFVQGAVLPSAMNFKSDLVEARILLHRIPAAAPIYSYQGEPMSRFFTINYYLHDRMRLFENENPNFGYLVLTERDAPSFLEVHSRRWNFTPLFTISKRGGESKCPTKVYKFSRKK